MLFLLSKRVAPGGTHSVNHKYINYNFSLIISADDMLKDKTYFSNGQLDKDGLVTFIKDIKKNTKLSDEDAAVLAASKSVLVLNFNSVLLLLSKEKNLVSMILTQKLSFAFQRIFF